MDEIEKAFAEGTIFLGPPGAAKSAVGKATGNTAGVPTIAFDLSAMQDSLVGASGGRLRAALADLGVAKSHSRPYVSDDNPFSESQFRTLEYRPEFPDRFGCIQDSRAFCQQFFQWYNQEHRHSGIGLLTPSMVFFGEAQSVLERRQSVLDAAYQAHPDRFVRRPPRPLPLPSAVWINKPVPTGETTEERSQ